MKGECSAHSVRIQLLAEENCFSGLYAKTFVCAVREKHLTNRVSIE